MAQVKIKGVQIDQTTLTGTGGALTPASVAAVGTVTGSNLSGTNTGDQTITLTSDVTGSGTGSFATTLATVNSNVGTFGSSTLIPVVTVNAKGLVTAVTTSSVAASTATSLAGGTTGALPYQSAVSTTAFLSAGTTSEVLIGGASSPAWSSTPAGLTSVSATTFNGALSGNATTATTLATTRTFSATGDATATAQNFDGSANVALPMVLATVNGSPQTDTFRRITVNGKGLTTATSAVGSSDITTALGYTPVNKAGDTMSGFLILNADPSAALGAVTKQYADAIAAGVNVHDAATTATTATLASSSGGTVTYANGASGVGATLTTTGTYTTIGGFSSWVGGDRVLVKDEATQANNGAYVRTSATVLTRADDFDGSPSSEIQAGDFLYVSDGTLIGTSWVQITTGTITVGTTAIVFTQYSGPGVVTAGTGISVTGNQVSNTGVLSVTGTTNQITVAGTGGPAYTGAVTVSLPSSVTIGGTMTAGTFSGSGASLTSIPNGALTNSSLTLGSTSMALGSTTTTVAGLVSTTSDRFVVNGSTVPTNGIYLSAANTFAIASNTTERITVNSTGNVTINAPSSGVALGVSGVSGTAAITGGLVLLGEAVGLSAGANVYSISTTQLSVGTSGNAELNLFTAGYARVQIAAAGNVTITAPSSGVALVVHGVDTERSLIAGYLDGLGGANNPRWEMIHTEATGLSNLAFTSSTGTRAGRISSGSLAVIDFSVNGNVTIAAPASGTALIVTGVAGATALAVTGGTGAVALVVNAPSTGNTAILATGAIVALPVLISAVNSDNTDVASHSKISAISGGAAGGDGIFTATVTGAQSWSWGVDNSDSDSFKLSSGLVLGVNDVLEVTTARNVTINAPSSGVAITVTGTGTSPILDLSGTTSGTFFRVNRSGTTVGDVGSGDSIVSGGTATSFGINSRVGHDLILGAGNNTSITITPARNATIAAPSSGVALTVTGLTTANTALDVTAATAGAKLTSRLSNTSNTASSDARQLVLVAGSSAGDALTEYQVSAITSWSVGVDNSASDNFVIAASSSLGTTDKLVIETGASGAVMIGTSTNISGGTGLIVSHTGASSSPIVVGDQATPASNSGIYIRTTGTAIFSTGSAGSFAFDSGLGGTRVATISSAGLVTATSFNATSTKRVKKAIKNISRTYLDKFADLRPREYDRKDYKAHEFGFIAEEMALVYPEVVGKDSNGTPTGIDYGKLSTILTAKVQEQQKVIDKLTEQMATVMGLVKGLK